MKRIVLAASFFAMYGLYSLPSFATPTILNSAPADRYFGRVHMSVLGMVNTLKDLLAFSDAHPGEARHIFDKAVLLEDAMMNWASLFPRDPWIPRLTSGLAQLYGRLDLDDARTRRIILLDWLLKTHPEIPNTQLPGN